MRAAAALLLWLAAVGLPDAAHGQARVPDITVDWVGIHELALCPRPENTNRFASAQREAERRLPEFRSAWAAEGAALLRATQRVVGAPFRYREAIAVLHVCEPHSLGTSYPLTVNISRFMAAYDGRWHRDPRWQTRFAELVYHEVLHRYLRDLTGAGVGEPMRPTPLMSRYANEPLFTRTHLHLLAIQRLVYRRLGRPEMVDLIRAYHENPDYRRADEIVDEIGPEVIVEDLRNAWRQRRGGN